MRGQARRPGAESQALALVVNDPDLIGAHPEWTKEIQQNRLTAAGWDALPPEIQHEAEIAYEQFYGMPMPDEEG